MSRLSICRRKTPHAENNFNVQGDSKLCGSVVQDLTEHKSDTESKLFVIAPCFTDKAPRLTCQIRTRV